VRWWRRCKLNKLRKEYSVTVVVVTFVAGQFQAGVLILS
jgi:hypothetical protein